MPGSTTRKASGRGTGFAARLLTTRAGAGTLVLVIAALLVLPPLGHRIIATGGFNGDDEARAPLLARDMITRHVWFDLHYRWEAPFRDKPPLFPWCIGFLSAVRGRVTEATAVAPVALATIAVALFTFLLGDRLFTRRAGLLAALVFLANFDVFANSQEVLPDMLVVAFATVAGWAFWRARETPAAREPLATFYCAVALSVFAKGPLGIVPLVAAGVFAWSEGGTREVARRLWSPLGVALFALLTLAWVVPFLGLGARSWGRNTIWGDWLTWYFGVPQPGDLVYTLVTGFLPWTLLVPLVLAATALAWRRPGVRFAFLWFAVPLVILLLSANQKRRYSLSMYPGLALLVGWWADAYGTSRSTARRLTGWLALGSAAALIVALHVPSWWDEDTRRYLTPVSWQLLPVSLGIAVIGVAMFVGLRRGRASATVGVVAVATLGILAYGIWPYNARYNGIWDFKGLAATVDRYAPGGEAGVFLHRFDWMALDFYLSRPPRQVGATEALAAYLARADRPPVVVDERDWRRVELTLAVPTERLERRRIGRETVLVLRGARASEPGATIARAGAPARR